MDPINNMKLQKEWNEKYTLTPEQLKNLIIAKLNRGIKASIITRDRETALFDCESD